MTAQDLQHPPAAGQTERPRRDIPVAIARAGIGQALMYGVPILAVLVVLPAEQVTSLDGLITQGDGQKYFSAALTVSIALIVLAYLLVYLAFLTLCLRRPDLERPFLAPGRPPRRLARHRPRHRLVAAGHRLPALARPGHRQPRRRPPGGVRGPAPPVRAAGPGPLATVVAACTVFHLAHLRSD
jgi:hypothetical protein